MLKVTSPDGVVWEIETTSQSGPPGSKGMQGNCGATWYRREGEDAWQESYTRGVLKLKAAIEEGRLEDGAT